MSELLSINGTETIVIGPLVLASDGIAKATGLTIPASEVLIAKENGSFAAKSDTTDCIEKGHGIYETVLGPSDLDVGGRLTVTLATTGILAWWRDYYVGDDVPGQAEGKGLSTCIMKLGPYTSKPNGRYETTAVSGVVIDVYTGTPPSLGAGTPSVSTDCTGFATLLFSPGSSKTTWYARATYPAGTWDPDQPSFVYVSTKPLN